MSRLILKQFLLVMAFEGKQINFWTSLSSINLFSTTMCTIPVKEWPHLDHWPLNYRPKKSDLI